MLQDRPYPGDTGCGELLGYLAISTSAGFANRSLQVNSSADKEHELEIEISTADVLKQGSLVRSGQANQYEQLIRGFVDNVRVLARHDRSRG